MRPKAIIALFFLFAISNTYAEEFVSFESGICKFNLQDYELPNQFERGIVFGVTTILETYKDAFGFSYPNDFKVKITIFSNKEKFLDYQRKQCGSIISETGYYAGEYRETVVLINKNSKKMLDETKRMVGVVFHEANHLISRHQIPWCPTWINEGLSEYFEGINVFGDERRIFLNQNRMRWCKYWLKKGFPISPQEYISLNYDQWMSFNKKDSNAAYTIGYSLVYFMMSQKSTEKVLKELLWEFKKQGENVNSIQTIDKCYPGGYKKFEKMWLKWIPAARPYRPLRALKEATNDNPLPGEDQI